MQPLELTHIDMPLTLDFESTMVMMPCLSQSSEQQQYPKVANPFLYLLLIEDVTQ